MSILTLRARGKSKGVPTDRLELFESTVRITLLAVDRFSIKAEHF